MSLIGSCPKPIVSNADAQDVFGVLFEKDCTEIDMRRQDDTLSTQRIQQTQTTYSVQVFHKGRGLTSCHLLEIFEWDGPKVTFLKVFYLWFNRYIIITCDYIWISGIQQMPLSKGGYIVALYLSISHKHFSAYPVQACDK